MTDEQRVDDDVGLSDNALTVLKKRYLAKDSTGEPVETPREMFMRVARNVAAMDILYHPDIYDPDGVVECPPRRGDAGDDDKLPEIPYLSEHDVQTLRRAWDRSVREGKIRVSFEEVAELARRYEEEVKRLGDDFFNLMVQRHFIPNSPTLMNAGRELQQLAACFVLPIEDSMESIFESIKDAALIHKSGGGTGFSFTRLRPKNDVVRTTGGIASGPVSFLKVFNAATEAVKQGGTRRGANMGILRVDHPDIEEFITCKSDTSAITNFNLSVALTDEFMEALRAGDDYSLVNPRNGEVVRTVAADKIFGLLAEMAYKNGEPGIIFIDRINDDNPTPALGEVESTNPCGEQPLLPYESCNLGSINLSAFVRYTGWVGDGSSPDYRSAIDWDGLADVVRRSVHFLDNVIDASKYPVAEIGRMTRANRKIGLGVMGWAEVLLRLGVPYDSEEAVELGAEMMAFLDREAKKASEALARTRGAFPSYQGSVHEHVGILQRNATTTTIAPTGTISIIGGTSSGVEPLFSIAFTRHVLDGEKLVEVNPVFEEVATEGGFHSQELLGKLAEGEPLGSQRYVPETVRRVFVTALDIRPDWHIRMQAAFQAHTDNAVSKTINFPQATSQKEIAQSFRQAYELGCKGLTVYRVGSRDEQVLTVGDAQQQQKERESREARARGPAEEWGHIKPLPRTGRLHGVTVRKATPMGNLFLTLNVHRGHPFELFAPIGKAGSDVTAFTEAIARLISLAFRCGVDPAAVADQLVGIGGSRSVGFGPNRVRSVPDAIGQFIQDCVESAAAGAASGDDDPGDGLQQLDLLNMTAGSNSEESRDRFSLCPACGLSTLVYQEGCVSCVSCGYTEC